MKRYYEPRSLRERLAALGWEFEVRTTAEFFLHAQGGRAAEA